jgi:hypothetical protein
MCEQQYFIEYVLGYRGLSNQKADKGTIIHKVLEILAFIKFAKQNNQPIITDDIVGNISVDDFNISNIYSTVYKYYTNLNTHHEWKPKDYKDCWNWIEKARNFNDGMFDPLKRNIVCPEQHFDFVIDKPWTKYEYNTPDGKLEGNLALKGTIDLITKLDDNFLEIIDWKSGRRLDWATGKQKTQESFEKDPQLRIYHYAVSHLYPNIDNIMFTINYINDGGPFSVCFQKSDLLDTEDMLRKKFEKIKSVKRPYRNRSWKCTKLCPFGKTTFADTDIPILEEYRDNQVTEKGECMTKCEQIAHDVELHGIDFVVQSYKRSGHSFGFYKAPGE